MAEELQSIESFVEDTLKLLSTCDEDFKPFVFGPLFHNTYKTLLIARGETPQNFRSVLSFLSGVAKAYSPIQNVLTVVHTDAIIKVMTLFFTVFNEVIDQLCIQDIPVAESIEYSLALENILNNLSKFEVEGAKESIDRLKKHIVKHALEVRVTEVESKCAQLALNQYASLSDFLQGLGSLEEELEFLLSEAVQGNNDRVVAQCRASLHSIEQSRSVYYKKDVQTRITECQNNRWLSPAERKPSFMRLIPPMQALITVLNQLTLSKEEKDNYLESLRLGWEITQDQVFLDVMTRGILAFYSPDAPEWASVTQYIQTAKANPTPVPAVRSDKKRKKVAFAFFDDSVNQPEKKGRGAEADELLANIIHQFVTMVERPKDNTLSRRFSASLLSSIMPCIMRMNDVPLVSRVLISYDLLIEARSITDNARMHSIIDGQIKALKKNHPSLSIAEVCDESTTDAPFTSSFTYDRFREILAALVNRLRVSVAVNHFADYITCLHQNVLVELAKGSLVNKDAVEALKKPLLNPLVRADRRAYPTLLDAMMAASSSAEFEDYLNHVCQSNQELVTLLTQRNSRGECILNDALRGSAWTHIETYLMKLKRLMPTKEDFNKFLLGTTLTGYTFLHQVAMKAPFEVVERFTRLLKTELPVDEYQTALNRKTNSRFIPSASASNKDKELINAFLIRERDACPRAVPVSEYNVLTRPR